MILNFINYPKCSTCKKAKKWLIDNNIKFEDRDIVENKPNKEELRLWIEKSGLPIKKFFNTSGILYRELSIKDKLPNMSYEEQIDLLASDGKMIKRPLIVSDSVILVGFKENDWKEKLI